MEVLVKKKEHIPPFPLQPKIVGWFIRLLGFGGEYSPESIASTISASLKRQHFAHTGEEVTEDIRKAMRRAVRQVRVHSNRKHAGTGKSPANIFDVQRIIEMTPIGKPQRDAEATLWLLGLYSGSRAITLRHVLLGDIQKIGPSELLSGYHIVHINFRVSKGKSNLDHSLPFEGRLDVEGSHDVVYYLNRYLRRHFSLSLLDLHNWPNSVKSLPLFQGWKEDAMSSRLRRSATQAGFPDRFFSMHSLRSGFLCSSIMFAGGKTQQAVLEQTAFIAVWAVGGQAQMRYVKPALCRTIVTTRMFQTPEILKLQAAAVSCAKESTTISTPPKSSDDFFDEANPNPNPNR